ncbi:hypothetical protein [Maliponia aquimaris]|nr:hypothetical protein [Maliponia aquimaris]
MIALGDPGSTGEDMEQVKTAVLQSLDSSAHRRDQSPTCRAPDAEH